MDCKPVVCRPLLIWITYLFSGKWFKKLHFHSVSWWSMSLQFSWEQGGRWWTECRVLFLGHWFVLAQFKTDSQVLGCQPALWNFCWGLNVMNPTLYHYPPCTVVPTFLISWGKVQQLLRKNRGLHRAGSFPTVWRGNAFLSAFFECSLSFEKSFKMQSNKNTWTWHAFGWIFGCRLLWHKGKWLRFTN